MKNPRATKLAWLLKQNNRYAPILDTGLKLAALLLPISGAVGLCLWTMFSNYLGWLGKASLPLAQAGDWLFLLAFGIAVSLYFGGIVLAPAALTALFRGNAPVAASHREMSQACVGSAAMALLSTLALLLWKDIPALISTMTPTLVGSLAAGLVRTRHMRPYSAILTACIEHAALSLAFLLWSIALLAFLLPSIGSVGESWPLTALLALSVSLFLLLILYIIRPAAGIFVGLVLSCFWIGEQASPQGGSMIPSALYTANLGGGRPAHLDQSRVTQGEICNLGVEAQPVLVFEPAGCEQKAALARLSKLKNLRSLDRKKLLTAWKIEAERQIEGASSHQTRSKQLDQQAGA